MQNKRLNEENIKELDQRIHYETFIREKKDAILEDRKNNVQEEDQQSHVSAVKTKYQALGQLVEQRSIANGMAKSIASMKSQAKKEGSMAGSQVQLNNRMDRDFPVAEEQDQMSTVSGLESEIDEWAALNKFAVLKEYYSVQQQKEI